MESEFHSGRGENGRVLGISKLVSKVKTEGVRGVWIGGGLGSQSLLGVCRLSP